MALYQTSQPFFGTLPSWLNTTDAARLASYEFFKAIFKNDTTGFKITLRDDEDNPIYVPSAKRIVRTLGRYVCKDLGFTSAAIGVAGADPEASNDDQAGADVIIAYGDLFKREEFFSNFRDAMEMGIAQGDFCLYVSADGTRPQGSRISLRWIDPATYFPMPDPADSSKTSGCRMVERVQLTDALLPPLVGETTKEYLRVQTWVKSTDPLHPSYAEVDPAARLAAASAGTATPIFIQYQSEILDVKDWEDPNKRVTKRTDVPLTEITGITQLPLYHFRNRGEVGERFGVSELEGLERLMFGINQAVTDEDVALAMAGLGLYVTNQKPVNANGEPTNWVIGPRRVVELSGEAGTFERVGGITSVTPYQDHVGYLQDMAESVVGISDVALGEVDTTVAESGIALSLRMGPILDEAERKDDRIVSKLDQFAFDLREWFAAYEAVTIPPDLTVTFVTGPKLPPDVDKLLARLQDLYVNGVIAQLLYVTKLVDLGVLEGDPKKIVADQQKEAQDNLAAQQAAMGDPGGGGSVDDGSDQLAAEAGGGGDPAAA